MSQTSDIMTRMSPLMEQYYTTKKQCDGAVLLFRVGDFYETFGDDAVLVARELNITLTSRQRDDQGNKIPLAGVPYHALDAYLAKLVKAGYKVAICDQAEDPKLARGLVKREVTRIITPGTVIEPSMLEEGSNNFLAAVCAEGDRAGLALVDVSTGEFLATEIPLERLSSEIARFRPSECLVQGSFALMGVRVQALEDCCFAPDAAEKALEGQFGKGCLARFGMEEKALCIRACGAILAYLGKAHFSALEHITEIRPFSTSDFMVLDEVTLRNLELLRNIRDRSKRGTLLEFLDRTQTPMGSRSLARWIQMPVLSKEEIERRLDAVEELKESPVLQEYLVQAFSGTSDLERLIGRISCGASSAKDLVTLKASLSKLPQICSALEEARSSCLSFLRSKLELGTLKDSVELIDRAIVEDPPASVLDGGMIQEGYDPELDEIRTAVRDGKSWISKLEASEKKNSGIKSLKVGYNNVFGYYIEVSRPNLKLVPPEYIRKQTLANAERFITPELKEIESKVISAQERSTAMEHEIFSKVRSEVASKAGEVKKRAAALGELDLLCTLALIAVENSFVRPEFNSNGTISLRGSKHPVLDRALKGGFVPNDVFLDNDRNRLIILTGPNMAGKSTFMRQIALASIMAQMGSFVPASFASLSLVDRIFTRVGAYDDLAAGQSTFMVEMTELANILKSATRNSLVLLDEIGRGTSTFDGLAIAWAVSEYLHTNVKAKTVFATHYHQLTQLEEVLPGIKNYNMAVKEERGSITFLRTVVPGATDKSYGVQVAKLAGVPDAVVKRASEVLQEIEKEAVVDPLGDDCKKRDSKKRKYTQLIFFDMQRDERPQAQKNPLIEEILCMDLDDLTPRDALNKLAEYQKRLRETNAQDQTAR